MSASTKEVSQALLDVRKAYRLLHDYQKAALDVAKYVGAQMGFTYSGGRPNFSDCAPREGKGSLDNWAWDWLNLVFYDFHFARKISEGQFLHFSIWLISDTGYFISDEANPDARTVASFAPVETSSTKVGFLFYREWPTKLDQLRHDRTAVRRFIEQEEVFLTEIKAAGIFGKCYDFSQLADEESANSVISDLIKLAARNGFPLEQVKKAV